MDVQGLVEMMRTEVGVPTLGLRYNPRAPRFSEDGFGCWEVVQRLPAFRVVDVDGQKVAHTVDVDKLVYRLNGNYDRPLVPGRWLITALCARDAQRHGRRKIRREINDRQESYEVAEQKSIDAITQERAKNKDLRRAVQNVAREIGVPMRTRDEILAMEKEGAQRMERQAEKRLRERKAARVYGDVP